MAGAAGVIQCMVIAYGIPTVRIFMADIAGTRIMSIIDFMAGSATGCGIMVVIDFLPVTCIVTILT